MCMFLCLYVFYSSCGGNDGLSTSQSCSGKLNQQDVDTHTHIHTQKHTHI